MCPRFRRLQVRSIPLCRTAEQNGVKPRLFYKRERLGIKGVTLSAAQLYECPANITVGEQNDTYINGGNKIKRNAFEYIRDYLGYRLALRQISKSGAAARPDNIIPYENGYNIPHEFTLN